MKTKHQCMALNRDMSDRCHRPATKMLATIPRNGETPSLHTVHLCGVCARRLDAGSRSLVLQMDDGTRHTVWVGHGVGEIYCKKNRGAA